MDSSIRQFLALQWIIGSRLQLERYKESFDEGYYPTFQVMLSLIEASNLLENLNNIRWLLDSDDKKNLKNATSKIINDMRNHIRHDSLHNANDTKHGARRKALGIKESLNFTFEPTRTQIKIGETVLAIDDISEYIDWATQQIGDLGRLVDIGTKDELASIEDDKPR